MKYIVVDLGGTSTRVALSSDGKTFSDKTKYDTPPTYKAGIDKLKEEIKKLAGEDGSYSVAMGMAGTFDVKTGVLIKSPNLPGWDGNRVGSDLEEGLGTRVDVNNDADMAALGEAVFGAGKGYGIVAMLTVGTGIGGAKVENRKLDDQRHGFEPGHQIIDRKLGKEGTLEKLASGRGFAKRCGVEPKDCTDPELWKEEGEILGVGVINTLTYWSPDVVVMGGGMMRDWDKFAETMKHYVEENFEMYTVPPIVKGELGDEMGLYGGLALLAQRKEND